MAVQPPPSSGVVALTALVAAPAGAVAGRVAGGTARGHDRPRGRPRAGRLGDRPAARRHPAALRHLRRDGLAWTRDRRRHGADRGRRLPRPGALGLLAAWLLGRGHAVASAVGAAGPAGAAAGADPQLVRVVVGARQRRSSCSPCRGGCLRRPQSAFAYLATWFLLLAAPRPVLELQALRWRQGARDSDADQLARLTRLPALRLGRRLPGGDLRGARARAGGCCSTPCCDASPPADRMSNVALPCDVLDLRCPF